MIGIMEDSIIQSVDEIADFTDTKNKGYGLETDSCQYLYHDDDDGGNHGDLENYAHQFQAYPRPLVIMMELDMTQDVKEHGILKYIIHNEKKEDVEIIRTDEEYTNIAYDDIDIDKKYRHPVSIPLRQERKWVELIDEIVI